MPAQSTHPRVPDAAPSVQYPLLTAEQVMQMLLISRTSLRILMRQQGLPYIKLGEGRRAALRVTRCHAALLAVSGRAFWRKEEA